MHSITNRNIRVAIVGGGIGALSCAASLRDCQNIEIDLFEAAAKFVAIGAGIVTWPRTWSVFRALGWKEEMSEALKGESPCKESGPAWSFRVSDQKGGVPFHDLYIAGSYHTSYNVRHATERPFTDGSATNLHRQQLLDFLLAILPSQCRVHFGHRLISCKESEDSVELQFLNGAVGSYDFVIGADGLKSVVRQTILRGPGVQPESLGTDYLRKDILYTGQSAFRGLIPKEKLAALYPDHRALHSSTIHIVAYPINNGKIVNVVAFFSDSRSGSPVISYPGSSSTRDNRVSHEAILATYPEWEEEAIVLLKVMEDPTLWPILDLNPLETYVSRRIALLGDAAHRYGDLFAAMSPHIGAGATTAIEDAYILGKIIANSTCTAFNIHRALEIYNAIRQPYGNEIMRWAHEMGDCYEFNSPELRLLGDGKEVSRYERPTGEQLSLFRKAANKYWLWPTRIAGTIEEDLKRAQLMLNEAKLC
ncbi:hypothetical protein BDP27DRAFT_1415319 [Rhodocollybia butyracea]|uniref:FAD-binding domain-containing protein n=1 Tax=Rhodocollybia butyracea TaxID=206335 RepID=A0A9P5Q8B5_9AGAR|nr:hypothetical protein BDP27DRAFT_1415319 [Rhodocollybia butyracea]